MRALLLLAIACGKADDDCTCKPTHEPSTRVLELLHRHRSAVRDGTGNGRDIKLVDDEIRVQSANLCSPCNTWVGERARVEELYPLDRLDEAAAATCMGL